MDSKFLLLCGSCYNVLPRQSGSVLSCGDFLCSSCSVKFPYDCPLCNKSVAKLDLNKPTIEIPEEVYFKLEDSTIIMEKLHGAVDFQLKSYKRVIRKLIYERNDHIK